MSTSARTCVRAVTPATISCLLVVLALAPGSSRAEPLEWSSWQMPSPRNSYVAGYDQTGNRYLIAGGYPWNGEVWALNLEADPSWSLENEDFPHRSGCLYVYDSAANSLLVFGGQEDGHPYSDVGHLALTNGNWSWFTPSGSPPPPHLGDNPGATYDATRNRFVILGSLDMASSFVFDPAANAWTSHANSGAVPTYPGGSAIYDPVRDRFVISTEDGTCQVTPDTFVWSLISPQTGGAAIYDAPRDRMVAVGYTGIVKAMSMTDPPVWTTLWDSALPGVSGLSTVAHDTQSDRLVVHSGTMSSNETWAFSLATNTWATILPGSPFETRHSHTSVLVRPWNALVSYGSQFTATSQVSRYALDGTGFQAHSPGGLPPIARQAHAAIHDPVRGRMVIFGGHNGTGGYFQDVHAMYTGATQIWTQLNPLGTLPAKRAGVEAVYDPIRDRMLVFGGYNETVASFRDLWALSLPAPPTRPTWTQLFDNGTPEQMPALVPGSAAMVYDSRRDRVVVLGTEPATSQLRAWACPLTGPPAWTPLAGSASERVAFDAAYDSLNDRVLVFGGRNVAGNSVTNELTALSFAPETWSTLTLPNAPAGRHSHTFINDAANGRFIVMGGREATLEPTTVWYLNDKGALLVGVPPGGTPARFALASCHLSARDRVRISADLLEPGEITLEVFDVLGRRWGRVQNTVEASGRREFTVPLDQPAMPGLYFVRVSQGARSAQAKLVALF